MILTCENCSTKFNFDESLLGSAGRKVRCASCKHVWHQAGVAKVETNIAEVASGTAEVRVKPRTDVKQPVVKEKKQLKLLSTPALKVAASVLVILNFVAFVFFNKEIIGQTEFYNIVGQYDTKAVEIINSEIASAPVKTGTNMQIAWAVKNTATKTLKMPTVRFRLYDEKLEQIGEKTNSRDKIKIEAGNELKFKDNLIHNTKVARYFTLEIGNNTELATR